VVLRTGCILWLGDWKWGIDSSCARRVDGGQMEHVRLGKGGWMYVYGRVNNVFSFGVYSPSQRQGDMKDPRWTTPQP
jgi:hypothetical protein